MWMASVVLPTQPFWLRNEMTGMEPHLCDCGIAIQYKHTFAANRKPFDEAMRYARCDIGEGVAGKTHVSNAD